jgi:hypothetical protein
MWLFIFLCTKGTEEVHTGEVQLICMFHFLNGLVNSDKIYVWVYSSSLMDLILIHSGLA